MDRQALTDALIAHLAAAAQVSEGVEPRSVLPSELQEALSRDEAALDEWRRLLACARLLCSLAARPAPADLDGRVVAALQPGQRQDRIAENLAALAARPVPEELDARVRRLAEQPFSLPEIAAPDLLDKLVEKELGDPELRISRRLSGRLSRRRAPRALRRRLAGDADRGRGRRLLPLAILMAIVGLSWSVMRDAGSKPADETVHAAGAFPFEVIRVDPKNSDQLDRTAVDLLNGLSGGVLEAGGR